MSSISDDYFCCPNCRSPLRASAGGSTCLKCGARREIDRGLYKFTTRDSTHGEFTATEMGSILAFAEANGWRRAVDERIAPANPHAAELIRDPRRRQSVSSLRDVGGRVLDFGCGYGGVSLALLEHFDEVVALDGSEHRVSFLDTVRRQERIPNLRTVCHNDVLHLPFSDESFDAVALVGVFEYLPQGLPHLTVDAAHHSCLRSFWRVLRPGGRLLIQTKNRFGWQYLLGAKDHSGLRFAPALPRLIADMILRVSGRGPYRTVNYSRSGYRSHLRRAEFDPVRVRWPVPGYQLPDHVVNLHEGLVEQLNLFSEDYFTPAKAMAIMGMARIGILSNLVPNLEILATKHA